MIWDNFTPTPPKWIIGKLYHFTGEILEISYLSGKDKLEEGKNTLGNSYPRGKAFVVTQRGKIFLGNKTSVVNLF